MFQEAAGAHPERGGGLGGVVGISACRRGRTGAQVSEGSRFFPHNRVMWAAAVFGQQRCLSSGGISPLAGASRPLETDQGYWLSGMRPRAGFIMFAQCCSGRVWRGHQMSVQTLPVLLSEQPWGAPQPRRPRGALSHRLGRLEAVLRLLLCRPRVQRWLRRERKGFEFRLRGVRGFPPQTNRWTQAQP